MIYVVTTRREESAFMPDERYAHLERVFGSNIKRIFATEDDDFHYIWPSDRILVQTRNRTIIDKLVATGAYTTAESRETVHLTHDKAISKGLLRQAGVRVPETIIEPCDGGRYFVKPMHGEDSNCIDEDSICTSREAIRKKVVEIETTLNDQAIIEEFVEGRDCTVGLVANYKTGVPDCWPVILDYESKSGILTHELKFKEVDVCHPLIDDKLIRYARAAFWAVGAKRYMRIDFRQTLDGDYVLIDLNLYPCLGATDHLAGCAKECAGIEYDDFIHKVVETATK